MSGCLDDVAAALVDGELDHAAREKAHRHLAHCAACRSEVEAQRRLKASVLRLDAPQPSDALTARLLGLAATAEPPAAGPRTTGSATPRPTTVGPATPPVPPPAPPPARRAADPLPGRSDAVRPGAARPGTAPAGRPGAGLRRPGVTLRRAAPWPCSGWLPPWRSALRRRGPPPPRSTRRPTPS